MKKVLILFSVLFILSGCFDDTYDLDYFVSNNSRMCGEFAMKQDDNNLNRFVIYKSTEGRKYKEFISFNNANLGAFFVTKDKLYVIEANSANSLIYTINVNDSSDMHSYFLYKENRDLSHIYGIKDDYLYFRFYDSDDTYKYGRIDSNLSMLEIIPYESLPKSYDYNMC